MRIIDCECHPTEDVAVLRLVDGDWGSIHDLSPMRHFGSAEVMMWAYPENVAKEHQNAVPPHHPEARMVRPDLTYFQGYIRPRIDREFPVGILRGSAFYEIGGACASGAPVTFAPQASSGESSAYTSGNRRAMLDANSEL